MERLAVPTEACRGSRTCTRASVRPMRPTLATLLVNVSVVPLRLKMGSLRGTVTLRTTTCAEVSAIGPATGSSFSTHTRAPTRDPAGRLEATSSWISSWAHWPPGRAPSGSRNPALVGTKVGCPRAKASPGWSETYRTSPLAALMLVLPTKMRRVRVPGDSVLGSSKSALSSSPSVSSARTKKRRPRTKSPLTSSARNRPK